MPRRPTEEALSSPAEPSTALTIPEDIRADLLRVQGESITSMPALPRYKMLPQGVGLFEADEAPGETFARFEGVVLGYHARNTLWDKPYGEERTSDEDKLPGCTSSDGKYGTPRIGFAHAALNGAVAVGTERIACASCPYNQWNSAAMLGKRGKGKAVTNQRELIVMIEGRALPISLILPPTSLTAFDEYLTTLLNRGMPIQAIVTEFTQERKQRETLRWSQATFRQVRPLTAEEFGEVMERRQQFTSAITPQTTMPNVEDVDATVVHDESERAPF